MYRKSGIYILSLFLLNQEMITTVYLVYHEKVLLLFCFDLVVNVSKSIFFVSGEYFRKLFRCFCQHSQLNPLSHLRLFLSLRPTLRQLTC